MIYICLNLPRVDEYGVPGRRLGPVAERPGAVAVREQHDAPERSSAPSRAQCGTPARTGSQALTSVATTPQPPSRAMLCAWRHSARASRGALALAPGATEAVEEVEPERREQVGDGQGRS